jgi:signal transduction histidine kinase
MNRRSGTETGEAAPAGADRPDGATVRDRWTPDAVPDVLASSRFGGAVVVLLACGLVALHVRHLFIMSGLVGTVIQVVLPLVLSVGLLWVGVAVWRGGPIDDREVPRFVGWVGIGVLTMFVVVVWIVYHDVRMGMTPHHPLALVANAATVGALAGVAIGSYDARRRSGDRVLQAKNRRLDEFAGLLAHDLRNPLGAAKGRLELARETADDPEDHLEAAAGSLDRMDPMVDDILALARARSDVLETTSVDIEWVAERAWEGVGGEGATLVVDGDPGSLRGDVDRVSQPFENLFRNAVEHSGADVTVRVGPVHDGFYVEDDGPGIPADDRDRVFEHGYTTAASTGLAIVREIPRTHDWTVSIENSDGGGTRFEFRGVVYDVA